MAYLGNNPTTQSFTSGTDYFSGTGSQTAFTLTRTVNSVNDIEVVINNVVQQPSTAYTLSGNTVTFTSAPSSGTNNIYVRYLATNMQSFTVPANSIDKSKLSSDLQAGFQGRNKIINGHMVVNQRNLGTVTINTSGTYTIDRWQANQTAAGKFTVQQSSTAPIGFQNSYLATSTSAYSVSSSDIFFFQQNIEGYNIADLAWGTANAKTVTLSAWVQSSLTGTFGGALANSTQDYCYPFTFSIPVANTWTQISVTITGATAGSWNITNGLGLQVIFGLGGGSGRSATAGTWTTSGVYTATGATSVVGTSGATFYITGVQLEEGTTATSFERETYSVTLQKCQRYFWSNTNATSGNIYSAMNMQGLIQSNGTTARALLVPPVTMRTSPSASFSAANTFLVQPTNATNYTPTAVALSSNSSQPNCIFVDFTVSGTPTSVPMVVFSNGTTAYAHLTAEL